MAYHPELFERDAGFHVVQGMVFPGFVTANNIEAVQKYSCDPSDIIVSAFPKSGQSWLQSILHIARNIEKLERGETLPSQPFYFLEWVMPGGPAILDVIAKSPPPRCIKTHLSVSSLKKIFERNPQLKTIQVMRHPKDCLVSFYNFYKSCKHFGLFNGTWDQFFEMYKEDKLVYTEITEYMNESYTFHEKRNNSLIIFYEQMQKDIKSEMVKIFKFLNFELTDAQIDLIMNKTSFKNMSTDRSMGFSDLPFFDYSRGNFLRKGVVGDWANYFSEDQSNCIDSRMGFLKDLF